MKTNKFGYAKNPFHKVFALSRRVFALFLSAVMLLGSVPAQGQSLFGIQTVKAAGISLSNPKMGFATWDCVYFGKYVQSDVEGAEPEPIKWRVLSVEGDDVFLLADKSLEVKQYHETRVSVTWETSTLRTWLNGDFLNTAFTEEEQEAIRNTRVVNENNPASGAEGGNDTTDKVYLLSIEEAMNPDYGFTSTDIDMDTRKSEDTAYVKKQNSGYGSSGVWWLRSPGYNSMYAAHVGASGWVGWTMGYGVSDALYPAVRPVLHINLQFLCELDYAGTVDSEGNVTEPESSDGTEPGSILSNPQLEYENTMWDCIYFGNYVQSDVEGAAPEPIKWRVLSVEGDDVFLLADKILEIKSYNDYSMSVTWETSTLRTWLNGEFLNTTFTAEERDAIRVTEVVNKKNPNYSTDGGNATTDRVYLLSAEEAMNPDYGFASSLGYLNTRKSLDTVYVQKQNSGLGSWGQWWLRSPGQDNKYAAYVSSVGLVRNVGNDVSSVTIGVRPVLHTSLQSLNFWDCADYAGTVDSDGNETEPESSGGNETKPESILSNPTTTEGGVTTWDCVYYGNYIQSDAVGAAPEPIKWRVLSVKGDDVFLLADKSLEIKRYNNTYVSTTWEKSTLRTWLNGDFLGTAFTAEEQDAIRNTKVVNENNPTYGTDGGNATTDKVYLLSIEEATNPAYGFTGTDTRKSEDTAYVKKQNSGYGSYGQWWLRSPGYSSCDAACVDATGTSVMSGMVDDPIYDGYPIHYAYPAVRPVLHIDLQSLSELNYAGTVDSGGNVTESESEASITVGTQTGTVTYGAGGSATYEIEGKGFDDPAFAPEVVWEDTAPERVTPAFDEGNTRLILTVSSETDAGTYRFHVASGDTKSEEAMLTIGKTTYTGAKTASKNVLSDKAVSGITVTLPELPDGAGYGVASVTTAAGLVMGMPSIAGTTLTFDVASKGTGTTDTIIIPVTGATNYTDYNVEVTITAVTKTSVTVSGVNVNNKIYDGTAVTKSGAPAANDGTQDVDISDYDYEWQNANGNTLAGAPRDAGSYKLVVSVSDNNAYYTGSQEISFTISKAAITITADDKKAAIGDLKPTYTYTVDGLASGESLKTGPTLSCTPDMGKAGTYTIIPSDAKVPDGGNYKDTITYKNGTLTVQWSNNGNVFTPVTNITGVPTEAAVGTVLTLKGTVQPTNATNRTIRWTVKSKGTTGAKITNDKLVTTGSGTVVITATVKNGKTSTADYTKDFTIKVSYPVKKGSTYTVSGYRYKVTSITNSKKTVTFVGLTAAKRNTATTVNIKDTVQIKGITMKITAVGKNALKGNKKVRIVKLGNNVQTIDYGAFSGCTALENVTVGTGLKTIGNQAFVKVKAVIKVPAAKVSAYKKLLKGKSGSLKVTK